MGYTKIDDRFFDDFARTLKPFTIIVFMFLFRASNKNAESWYTFSTIAFKMGISLRSVKNAIKELKDKKLITIKRRYNKPATLTLTGEALRFRCLNRSARNTTNSAYYAPLEVQDVHTKDYIVKEDIRNSMLTLEEAQYGFKLTN